jgi:hypothetical protein
MEMATTAAWSEMNRGKESIESQKAYFMTLVIHMMPIPNFWYILK